MGALSGAFPLGYPHPLHSPLFWEAKSDGQFQVVGLLAGAPLNGQMLLSQIRGLPAMPHEPPLPLTLISWEAPPPDLPASGRRAPLPREECAGERRGQYPPVAQRFSLIRKGPFLLSPSEGEKESEEKRSR